MSQQRPEQSPQSHWLEELIGLIRLLCPPEKKPGEATAEQGPTAKRRGMVTPDDQRESGWFSIPLAGQAFESDQLESAYLAPRQGDRNVRFQLIETVHDGNVLRVRAAEHAPRSGLYLWVPDRDNGRLYTSLRDGLAHVLEMKSISNSSGLIDKIAAGIADLVPPAPPGEAERLPGLNEGQRGALRACLAPGVQLVWGPPGTGKTQVISRALSDLMRDGKSVLLVSGTNIAVDNALERAARDIKPEPGVMIRVGDPHLPEIAANPAIFLESLIREQQQVLEHKRQDLTNRIADLRADPAIVNLEAQRAALGGFDAYAYQTAGTRLRNALALTACEDACAAAEARAADAHAAAATADTLVSQSASQHAEASAALPYLDAIDSQNQYLGTLRKKVEGAGKQVAQRQRDRDEAAAALAATRNPFGRGRRRESLAEAEGSLARAQDAFQAANRLLEEQIPLIAAEIAANRQAAKAHTREAIAALGHRVDAAKRAADNAARAAGAQERQAQKAAAALARARSEPQPTAADADLVARADAAGLPTKLARLRAAEKTVTKLRDRIRELEDEHEEVLGQMRKDAFQVRKSLVHNAQVIATTLAMVRMRPELHERSYDHVLVDEVSFAPSPDVVYAASRATTGVTLLGDFLQNGPIMPDKVKSLRDRWDRAQADHWYGRDLFAFFEITSPNSAQRNPGCAVLTQQYRFGAAITKLANDAAYGGLLTAGRAGTDGEDGPEVVFVDVDGLGSELTEIRLGVPSGKWWPVGALVARALAAQRVKRGGKVGVVVPYRSQADLVQEIVKEDGLELNVSVGTAHAFQGREFETVIFDLVDNDGTGWIATGNLHDGLSGLRVFNVGVTRTKRRLYLVGNATAVRGAKRGPLKAIANLGAGEVRVVRARKLLALPEMPLDNPIEGEVWEALHNQVTIVGIYDERLLPDELRRRLDNARERVWVWSPWVGRSSKDLLPHLRAAQDRDVIVHPVVLWPEEVQPDLRDLHSAISRELARTVYLKNMHQKIIVIDGHLTFIGSMNVLAHPAGGRLETMALLDSRALASQYLKHERADELSKPPTCGNCQIPVRRVQRVTQQGRARLFWVCRAPTADGTCSWRQEFPPLHGGRYEWQPKKETRKPARKGKPAS